MKLCTICKEAPVHPSHKSYCPPCLKVYQQKWYLKQDKNAEYWDKKGWYRKEWKYGITKEQYEQMHKNQNGVCAICKSTEKTGRKLAIDHDHETNKVRGLLCTKCNNGLGNFKDSKENLQAALNYLEV